MRDYITQESTCLLGDPCLFNLSPTHNEQSGRVVGRTFGRIMLFDIEMPDGSIHQNVSNVRLDRQARDC